MCVYVTTFFYALQIVQRSLSGGFLTRDTALLAANVRATCSTKPHRHHTPFVGGGPLTAQTSREKRPQKAAVSCEAVERFALGPNFYKQVLVVAAAGNDNSEVPCTRYYGVWVSALTQVLTLYPYLYPYPYP